MPTKPGQSVPLLQVQTGRRKWQACKNASCSGAAIKANFDLEFCTALYVS